MKLDILYNIYECMEEWGYLHDFLYKIPRKRSWMDRELVVCYNSSGFAWHNTYFSDGLYNYTFIKPLTTFNDYQLNEISYGQHL